MQVNFVTMTLPAYAVWGGGFLLLLVGALLGYFNVSVDARRKMENVEQRVENARLDADRRIAEMQKRLDEAREAARTQTPLDEPSLLRIKVGGDFQTRVEMDNQLLTAPLSSEKKQRLLELLNLFRVFLDDAPLKSAPKPTPQPITSPLSEPISMPRVAAPVEPIPATISFRAKPKTDAETEFKLLSMVKQIDAVLQTRLRGTALEEQDIRLNDSAQGGLEVQVGARTFETIDAVPDEEIKSAIRAAIAEWEKKYVPGM
ncbi:MAG: hypothetical protein LC099_07780 [Anaerolineales bacterium]|nr:hypothetical protein [Anaerolineales bacterium]